RALFPKEWNDVTKEKPLFYCWSHYSGALRVTLGAVDDKGRRLLSLVPLEEHRANAKQDKSKDVFRIWLDKAGRSAATRKIFRHHYSTAGIVLDSRRAVRTRRWQGGFRVLHGQRQPQVRRGRCGVVLQQSSAVQRVPRRCL